MTLPTPGMLLHFLPLVLVFETGFSVIISIIPILGFFGALYGWYTSYKKNQREITKEEELKLDHERIMATELEARKQAYISFQAKVEERFTGVTLALERMGDSFKAKTDRLDQEVSQIPALRDLLGRLETKMEMNGKATERMEGKLDRFLENFHK